LTNINLLVPSSTVREAKGARELVTYFTKRFDRCRTLLDDVLYRDTGTLRNINTLNHKSDLRGGEECAVPYLDPKIILL
jgi:hypothetical protein